jgi:hypothetical protein
MEAEARTIVLCTHRRAQQGVTVSGVFSPVRGNGRLFHRQTHDIRADLSASASASSRRLRRAISQPSLKAENGARAKGCAMIGQLGNDQGDAMYKKASRRDDGD